MFVNAGLPTVGLGQGYGCANTGLVGSRVIPATGMGMGYGLSTSGIGYGAGALGYGATTTNTTMGYGGYNDYGLAGGYGAQGVGCVAPTVGLTAPGLATSGVRMGGVGIAPLGVSGYGTSYAAGYNTGYSGTFVGGVSQPMGVVPGAIGMGGAGIYTSQTTIAPPIYNKAVVCQPRV